MVWPAFAFSTGRLCTSARLGKAVRPRPASASAEASASDERTVLSLTSSSLLPVVVSSPTVRSSVDGGERAQP